MSRIGNLPIAVPSGVTIAVDGDAVRLEGPKGKLTAAIPSGISVKVDGTIVQVQRGEEARKTVELHLDGALIDASEVTIKPRDGAGVAFDSSCGFTSNEW